MPQKKEPLPVKVDVDLQNGGTITYANEVIATIAGVAANEVDGIAGMCISGGFGEILSRNRNITRGVKVEVGSQEAAVDLYIIVEYGKPIQRVATDVQENVRKALESLTGLHVVRVDVHVQGVSFEKEKKAAQTSIEAAKQQVLTEAAADESVKDDAQDELTAQAEAEAEIVADEEVLAEEASLDGDAEEAKAECDCCCEEEAKAECDCCCEEEAKAECDCCCEEEAKAECDCCEEEAKAEGDCCCEEEKAAEEPAKKPARRPGNRKRG